MLFWWFAISLAIYAAGCLVSLFFVILDWKFICEVADEKGRSRIDFAQQIIFYWPVNILLSPKAD